MKAVIVCGDRNWSNKEVIRREMEKLPNTCVVIEGGAKGADTIAKMVAGELEMPVIEVKAEWDKYGKYAGPIRNRKMLVENLLQYTSGKSGGTFSGVKVLAFHEDIMRSKGTKNMLLEAKKFFVESELFSE